MNICYNNIPFVVVFKPYDSRSENKTTQCDDNPLIWEHMVLKDQVPQNIRKNENVGVAHDLSPSHPSVLIHERILDTLEMIEAFEGLNKMR